MSYARQMLDTYPRALTVDASMLAAVIDAITDCAQACITDTDADLGEQNPDRDDQVHPAVPGLRRCLHRRRRGGQPSDGLRRRRHQAAAASLRGHLPELRR